jgi:hypothetical protein
MAKGRREKLGIRGKATPKEKVERIERRSLSMEMKRLWGGGGGDG